LSDYIYFNDLNDLLQDVFFEEMDPAFYYDRLRGGLILRYIYDESMDAPFYELNSNKSKNQWNRLKNWVDNEIDEIFALIEEILDNERSEYEDEISDQKLGDIVLSFIKDEIFNYPDGEGRPSFQHQLNSANWDRIDDFDDLMTQLKEWRDEGWSSWDNGFEGFWNRITYEVIEKVFD
jgi:hypothetical protein